MKIALYSEKLTLQQDWEGAISTQLAYTVLRTSGFINTYVHRTKLTKSYCGLLSPVQ